MNKKSFFFVNYFSIMMLKPTTDDFKVYFLKL